MNHWARPGAECVCVSAGWRRGRSIAVLSWLRLCFFGLPIVGANYVLTAVGSHTDTHATYVRLKGFGDVWFHLSNFRPLTKTQIEKDVALFTPLLDPAHPPIFDDAPKVPA